MAVNIRYLQPSKLNPDAQVFRPRGGRTFDADCEMMELDINQQQQQQQHGNNNWQDQQQQLFQQQQLQYAVPAYNNWQQIAEHQQQHQQQQQHLQLHNVLPVHNSWQQVAHEQQLQQPQQQQQQLQYVANDNHKRQQQQHLQEQQYQQQPQYADNNKWQPEQQLQQQQYPQQQQQQLHYVLPIHDNWQQIDQQQEQQQQYVVPGNNWQQQLQPQHPQRQQQQQNSLLYLINGNNNGQQLSLQQSPEQQQQQLQAEQQLSQQQQQPVVWIPIAQAVPSANPTYMLIQPLPHYQHQQQQQPLAAQQDNGQLVVGSSLEHGYNQQQQKQQSQQQQQQQQPQQPQIPIIYQQPIGQQLSKEFVPYQQSKPPLPANYYAQSVGKSFRQSSKPTLFKPWQPNQLKPPKRTMNAAQRDQQQQQQQQQEPLGQQYQTMNSYSYSNTKNSHLNTIFYTKPIHINGTRTPAPTAAAVMQWNDNILDALLSIMVEQGKPLTFNYILSQLSVRLGCPEEIVKRLAPDAMYEAFNKGYVRRINGYYVLGMDPAIIQRHLNN